MARNYWIVDCISGYRDEDSIPFTKIVDARSERDRLNAERVAQGGSDGFWIIIDSKGNTID